MGALHRLATLDDAKRLFEIRRTSILELAIPGISVAEAELSLKTAVAATTNLRIARAQYEHAIALLTGQAASTFSMSKRSLATSVPVIPIGVPSQILQRRPDIGPRLIVEITRALADRVIQVARP